MNTNVHKETTMSEETFTLTFTIDQINTVLDALSEIQYKKSASVIEDIRAQTIAQIKERAATENAE